MGALSTLQNGLEKSWWPTIDKDVKYRVDRCPSCGACPHNSQTPAKVDGMLPQCMAPNQRVHVDLFGPLKTSQEGHKFVLIYTDAFSRLCRLTAIPDKSAPTVADTILPVSYTHLRAHETEADLVCRLLLEK